MKHSMRMSSDRNTLYHGLVLLAATVGTVGCTDDPPVRAEFNYQTNCTTCPRVLERPIDGAASGRLHVACEVSSSGRLSFQIRGQNDEEHDNQPFELNVISASRTERNNGECVRLVEAGATYRGSCSPSAPTNAAGR
jgi:hypothetical protein